MNTPSLDRDDPRGPLRLDVIEEADLRGSFTRLLPARPEEAELVCAWAVDPGVAPFWGGRGYYADMAAFAADWGPHFFEGSAPPRAGRSS